MLKISPRRVYYSIPVEVRFLLRRVLFLPYDIYTYKTRKKEIIPPKGLQFIGGGDFIGTGKRLASRLKEHAGLCEESKLLDIGCGIGRVARALVDDIKPPGFYEGFDIVEAGIKWCKNNITPRYKNFNFNCVNISNDLYTNGGGQAINFIFPYPDKHFNIALATSVFTHMLPDEVEEYMKETNRVLIKGGILYATFFCGSAEDPANPFYSFRYKYKGYALMSEKVKRANVFYDKTFLHKIIEQSGFEIKKFLPGKWNNNQGVDLQDSFVLVKK